MTNTHTPLSRLHDHVALRSTTPEAREGLRAWQERAPVLTVGSSLLEVSSWSRHPSNYEAADAVIEALVSVGGTDELAVLTVLDCLIPRLSRLARVLGAKAGLDHDECESAMLLAALEVVRSPHVPMRGDRILARTWGRLRDGALSEASRRERTAPLGEVDVEVASTEDEVIARVDAAALLKKGEAAGIARRDLAALVAHDGFGIDFRSLDPRTKDPFVARKRSERARRRLLAEESTQARAL